MHTAYYKGKGTERNLLKAFFWLKESGKLSFPEAYLKLGIMCLERREYQKAQLWFQEAEKRGLSQSDISLGIMIYDKHIMSELSEIRFKTRSCHRMISPKDR